MGDKEVIPREVDLSTGGRVHLNARDHIVIAAAEYADSNVYRYCYSRVALYD